jgi:hypothetical protein
MVLLSPDAFLVDLSRVFNACQKGSVFVTLKAQVARKVARALSLAL